MVYKSGMLSDADRSWLKELHSELWPPQDDRSPMQRMADRITGKEPTFRKTREKLSNEEVLHLFEIIRQGGIVVEPTSHGPICGIAISLWDHEQFIGTGPDPLLYLTDNNLPEPTSDSWHSKLLGRVYEGTGKQPGGIRDDAWDLFLAYSKVDQNVTWLKTYKLQAPRERIHYEY